MALCKRCLTCGGCLPGSSSHRLLPLFIPPHLSTSQTSPYPPASSTLSVSKNLFKNFNLQDTTALQIHMTPSELHALHEAPGLAAPKPRSSSNLLPTGKAATAMLTLGAVAAGGLYTVGRIVAKRLVIPVSKKDVNEDEDEDKDDKEGDNEPKEDEKQVPTDTELIAKESDLYPSILVAAECATLDIGLSHQGSSDSFQIWEKSTLDRIKGAKQRRLDQRVYSIHDIDAWYQATMSRFQQERDRRLIKLRKQREDAARGRELEKMQEGCEERGINNVRAWPKKRQRQEVGM